MPYNTIKLFFMFILLYFSSCTNKNSSISEYINLIDKTVPVDYIFEDGNKYTKRIITNKGEIWITVIAGSDNIIQSCYITFMFSDFINSKQYYNHCINYMRKGKWQFIQHISKYKRPNGELYLKKGIYFGIYEPISYNISIGLSKSSKNLLAEGFYE